MKFRQTPIASAVAFALLGATFTTQAQQTTDTAETIVVTGIRASLEKSLAQKRNAETHVEVITAEDIGKMPDKNVADSLQRLPGVTISSAGANEGGFDENDRVSMRGTNASLTQTLMNGHPVSSGDWFVLNQTDNAGRSVSYSMLPSELVGSVVVHKASEASLVEGGVVGSVNIITRKPLEFSKPMTLEGSIGAVYADLPKKTDPQFSALFNWKNDANTVGVLVQGFSEKRHLRRDGVEILGYNQILATSNVAKTNPDLAGVWYPRSIGAALFEQERHRKGGLIEVQVKPMSTLTMSLTAFSSKLEASNFNRNYLLHAPFFLNEGAGQAPEPGYVVRNNTLVQANFKAVTGTNYGTYDQISRPGEGASTDFINFDAKFRPMTTLVLNVKAGTSKGVGKTPTQDVAPWNVGGGGSWKLNGVGTAPDFAVGTPANSPAGASLDWIWGAQNVNIVDKDTWAQLDAEYSVNAGPLSTIKFGARMAEHKRSSDGVIAQGPTCRTTSGTPVAFDWSQQYWCPVGTIAPPDPANWPTRNFQNYPSNFGAGLGGNFPRNIWYYTPGQLADANARLAYRDPVIRAYPDWNFGLKEKANAAYVQGNLEGSNWRGNVGLRLVQTKEHVLKYIPVPDTAPGAIKGSAFGAYLPVTTDHSYNDVLPSASIKFDLSKDLVARAAISKTMTRPDYAAIAGVLSLSPPASRTDTGSGSGSNPDLKPIRSTNFDATLEYYFAPRSLASASVFYMNLNSYVSLGQEKRQYITFDAANPNGYMGNYVLTMPVNAQGTAKGVELSAEMPIMGNFGVSANYTYTDAKEKGGGPLVGASRNTYNLVAYYEDDHFNARIGYNFRSHFYSGLDRSTAFNQDDTVSVSASLGYKLNDNLSFSLDARNLNNPKLQYYALSRDQPRSVYMNGRQYYLNARFKF